MELTDHLSLNGGLTKVERPATQTAAIGLTFRLKGK
jgi:hypothetical protein